MVKIVFSPPRVSPFPFRRESSEASRGGKRRNSHQSAVFGEAGNGTVAGISELVRATGLEPARREAREPKSRMSTNFIMPANAHIVYHKKNVLVNHCLHVGVK